MLRELEVVLKEEIEERRVPFDLPAAQQAADLMQRGDCEDVLAKSGHHNCGDRRIEKCIPGHEEYSTVLGSRCSPD